MSVQICNWKDLYLVVGALPGRIWLKWFDDSKGTLVPCSPPRVIPLPISSILQIQCIARENHILLVIMQPYQLSGFCFYPNGSVVCDGMSFPAQVLSAIALSSDTAFVGCQRGDILMVNHDFSVGDWSNRFTSCRPRKEPIPITQIKTMDYPASYHVPLVTCFLYADGKFLLAIGNSLAKLFFPPVFIQQPFTEVEWLYEAGKCILVMLAVDNKSKPIHKLQLVYNGTAAEPMGIYRYGATGCNRQGVTTFRRSETKGHLSWAELWLVQGQQGELHKLPKFLQSGKSNQGDSTSFAEAILGISCDRNYVALLMSNWVAIVTQNKMTTVQTLAFNDQYAEPLVYEPWVHKKEEEEYEETEMGQSDEQESAEEMEVDLNVDVLCLQQSLEVKDDDDDMLAIAANIPSYQEAIPPPLYITEKPSPAYAEEDFRETISVQVPDQQCISEPTGSMSSAAVVDYFASVPSAAIHTEEALTGPSILPEAQPPDGVVQPLPSVLPVVHVHDTSTVTTPPAMTAHDIPSDTAPPLVPLADIPATTAPPAPVIADEPTPLPCMQCTPERLCPQHRCEKIGGHGWGRCKGQKLLASRWCRKHHCPHCPNSKDHSVLMCDSCRHKSATAPSSSAAPQTQTMQASQHDSSGVGFKRTRTAADVPTGSVTPSKLPKPAAGKAPSPTEVIVIPEEDDEDEVMIVSVRPPPPPLRQDAVPSPRKPNKPQAPVLPSTPQLQPHHPLPVIQPHSPKVQTQTSQASPLPQPVTSQPPLLPQPLQPLPPLPLQPPVPLQPPLPPLPPVSPAPPAPPVHPIQPPAAAAAAAAAVPAAEPTEDERRTYNMRERKPEKITRRPLTTKNFHAEQLERLISEFKDVLDPDRMYRPLPQKVCGFLYCNCKDDASVMKFQRCHDNKRKSDKVRVGRVTDPASPCYGELGCFATRDIAKDEDIGVYAGVVQLERNANNASLYIACLPARAQGPAINIDAAEVCCETAFINDAHGTDKQNNAYFSGDCNEAVFDKYGLPLQLVRAKHHIPQGTEILVSYGQEYWDVVLQNDGHELPKDSKVHTGPVMDFGNDLFPKSRTFSSLLLWDELQYTTLCKVSSTVSMKKLVKVVTEDGSSPEKPSAACCSGERRPPVPYVAKLRKSLKPSTYVGWLGGEVLFSNSYPVDTPVVYNVREMQTGIWNVIPKNECMYFLEPKRGEVANCKLIQNVDQWGRLGFAVVTTQQLDAETVLTMSRIQPDLDWTDNPAG